MLFATPIPPNFTVLEVPSKLSYKVFTSWFAVLCHSQSFLSNLINAIRFSKTLSLIYQWSVTEVQYFTFTVL